MLKICLQEHLLMTFSYTSKAARDMMRLYAPKKHRSKKQGGRKVQPVIFFTFTNFSVAIILPCGFLTFIDLQLAIILLPCDFQICPLALTFNAL